MLKFFLNSGMISFLLQVDKLPCILSFFMVKSPSQCISLVMFLSHMFRCTCLVRLLISSRDKIVLKICQVGVYFGYETSFMQKAYQCYSSQFFPLSCPFLTFTWCFWVCLSHLQVERQTVSQVTQVFLLVFSHAKEVLVLFS